MWRPAKTVRNKDEDKNKRRASSGHVCGACGRCQAEIRMNFVLVVIGLVLLLLGIVLGKLF